jgi:hypothetical protein
LNSLLDDVDDAANDARKARRKGREQCAIADRRLQAATAAHDSFRHSIEYSQHLVHLREMLSHFPELFVLYPEVEPFRGTAAEVDA